MADQSGEDVIDELLACTPLLSALPLGRLVHTVPTPSIQFVDQTHDGAELPASAQDVPALDDAARNRLVQRARSNLQVLRTSYQPTSSSLSLEVASFRAPSGELAADLEHDVSVLLERLSTALKSPAPQQNGFATPASRPSALATPQRTSNVKSPLETRRRSSINQDSASAPKRRKKQHAEPETPVPVRTSDQPPGSNTAVSIEAQFQRLISDVFEAHDELQLPDQQTEPQAITNGYFTSSTTDASLTGPTLAKILLLMRRFSLHKRTVSLEDSARLSAILLASITSIDHDRLARSGLNDPEDKLTEWQKLLESAQSSSCAATAVVVLQELNPERTDLTEETLLVLLDCARAFLVETYAVWLGESDTSRIQHVLDRKEQVNACFSTSLELLGQLRAVFSRLDLADDVVSRMEFLGLDLFFLDSSTEIGAQLASRDQVAMLKQLSFDLLAMMYARKPSQRDFLRAEVLGRMSSLSALKNAANTYRLDSGKTIRLTSMLLLEMMQAGVLDVAHNKDAQTGEAVNILQQCVAARQDCLETSIAIVHQLFQNTLAASKEDAKEATSAQTLFAAFFEDMLSLSGEPLTPAVEVAIRGMVISLSRFIDSPKLGVSQRSTTLDYLAQLAVHLRALDLSTVGEDEKQLSDADLDLLMSRAWRMERGPREMQAASFFIAVSLTAAQADEESDSQSQGEQSTHAAHNLELFRAVHRDPEDEFSAQDVEHAQALHLRFCLVLGMIELSDSILPRILTLLDHAQITLRVKALRAISGLADIDADLLSYRVVQEKVVQLIADSSPQVRESALELLGKYIAYDAAQASRSVGLLADRLKDPALSVRKRVVRLLREMYIKGTDEQLRNGIASHLLQCLADEEESITDLVTKFYEEVFSGALEHGSSAARLRLQHLTGQADQHNVQLLGALLQTLEPRLSDTGQHPFRRIVNELLSLHSSEKSDASTLKTLLCIASNTPQHLAVDDLEVIKDCLQPKSANGDQASAVVAAEICTCVLTQAVSAPSHLLLDLEKSLLPRLTSSGSVSLTKFIPCLCRAAELRRDFDRPVKVLMNLLAKLQQPSATSSSAETVLVSTLIGLLGRHLALRDVAFPLQKFGAATAAALYETLARALTMSIGPDSSTEQVMVRRAGVQALCNICIAAPELYQADFVCSALDMAIATGQAESHLAILSGLLDFLRQEIAKMTPSTAASPVKGRKPKKTADKLTSEISSSTDESTGIALVQRYNGFVLESCLSSHVRLGIVAGEVLAQIVKGLVIGPHQCMPTIVALETSRDPSLQAIAFGLHRTLYQRFETNIDNCYLPGLRRAVEYPLSLANTDYSNSPIPCCLPMYTIVKSKRRSRRKLLTDLSKTFDIDVDRLDRLDAGRLACARMIAHDLCCIDYTLLEDVLLILHQVSKYSGELSIQLAQLHREQSADPALPLAMVIASLGLHLTTHLQRLYGMKSAQVEAYDPSKSYKDSRAVNRKSDIALFPDWQVEMDASQTPRAQAQIFIAHFDALETTRVVDEADAGDDTIHDDTSK